MVESSVRKKLTVLQNFEIISKPHSKIGYTGILVFFKAVSNFL